MSNVKILDSIQCTLGEGCQVSLCKNYVAWVDIIEKHVYIYSLKSNLTSKHRMDSVPSAIFKFNYPILIILDDKGIVQLNLKSKEILRLKVFDQIACNDNVRGNDGIYYKDKYIFGTMEYSPKHNSGNLYCFSQNELVQFDTISIPNTFIPLDNGLLISDSMTRKIYLYDLVNFTKKIWCNLSGTDMTPDGGCISSAGRIFISMWGSSCVIEFDQEGQQIAKYPVPAQNPTNCCLFAEQLLVTSANIDITPDHKSLKNGQTFLIDI